MSQNALNEGGVTDSVTIGNALRVYDGEIAPALLIAVPKGAVLSARQNHPYPRPKDCHKGCPMVGQNVSDMEREQDSALGEETQQKKAHTILGS